MGAVIRARNARLRFGAAGIAAGAAGLAAAATWVALFGPGEVFGGDDDKAPARLTLDKVVVRNGLFDSNSVGLYGEQTKGSSPTIDLTLFNEGEVAAGLTDAHIDIIAFAHFDACYRGGGGTTPASPANWTELPYEPRPTERQLTTDLFYTIGRGEPYRLLLRFRHGSLHPEADSLYALRVSLRTRDGQSVKVGKFLLSLPAALDRSGATFPEDAEVLKNAYQAGNRTALTWCYRRNLAELKRVLAVGGHAAPELRAFRDFTVAPNWPSISGHPSPRRSARTLLESDNPGDIDSAVLAAQQSDDQGFAERIRAAAARRWLDNARESIAQGVPTDAARAARKSLALKRSPQAERVLADANRALAQAAVASQDPEA